MNLNNLKQIRELVREEIIDERNKIGSYELGVLCKVSELLKNLEKYKENPEEFTKKSTKVIKSMNLGQ